jgi:hypothetical protein
MRRVDHGWPIGERVCAIPGRQDAGTAVTRRRRRWPEHRRSLLLTNPPSHGSRVRVTLDVRMMNLAAARVSN